MSKTAWIVCTLLATGCYSLPKLNSDTKPDGKALLQDESRPIQYVFVSEPTENDGAPPSEDKFSVTDKIVEAVLPALTAEQKLYFVGSKQSFGRLIANDQRKSPALAHITARPYMWLQDLIEFGETDSGSITFLSYGNISMKDTAKEIGRTVAKGDPEIRVLKSTAVQGTVGGNIEKWPGDIGVLGTSDFESDDSMTEFARQIFPTETLLKVPTSWLTIGHVDDVVKLLRYRPGDRCEIQLLVNSPDAALKTLSEEKHGLFLDELTYGDTRISQIQSIQELCTRGDLKCVKPRNGQISAALKQGALKINLDAVRKNIAALKQVITKTYQKQMPNCAIQWLEAPSIHLLATKNGEPVRRSGQSVLPSLTNGLLVNETYIAADPGNAAFRKAFATTMANIGIKVSYVPLGKFVFRGNPFDGHIHCMTQVFRK